MSYDYIYIINLFILLLMIFELFPVSIMSKAAVDILVKVLSDVNIFLWAYI